MYSTLKSILKKIIPRRLLFSQERLIRNATYLFYKGDKFHCNICDAKLSKFIRLEADDFLCPRCGSLPRTRRLWKMIEPLLVNQPKILHFSPSRALYRKLKSIKNLDYLSTDYENEFLADLKLDIRQTGLATNTFDLIICFHVLEHIDEDLKAMQELLRILKPAGQCLIHTPFKEGEIYENDAVRSPEDRLAHFGQADHVRIYAVEGLKSRLENTGFMVDAQLFENEADNRFGYKEKEVVLNCQKP